MNTRGRTFNAFVVLLVAVTLLTSAWAQRSDGTLRGTILDSTGAVVANATVTATNNNTGVARSTVTTSAGTYNLPNLLIGSYTVTVAAPGFAPYSRKDVQVLAAQVIEVSANLGVAGATETVDVQAGADVVQTETFQLSSSFSERAVTEVPTVFSANGFGSVQNLAVYLPNTTTQLGGTSGNGGSVGGLRGRQNSFSIDGATNSDTQVSISSLEVIQDAVAEFTLSTNQFSAEYGSAAGGQFNVVTKTGTNDVRGSMWWYSSNRHLNASGSQEAERITTGQQAEKDRFDYNRLGGQVGGPVINNRLFFFGAYEYQTTGSQPTAPAGFMPTSAGFGMLDTLAANDEVRDLLGQFPVASSNDAGTVLVNGQAIPIGTVTAVAASYLSQHDWIANVDFNAGAHQLRLRHLKNRVRTPLQGAFPQGQFDAITAVDNRRLTFNDVWILNSRMVNDLKLSFGRLVSDSPLTALAASYPTLVMNDLDILVGPATNLPQSRTSNWYQVADSLSVSLGAHTFKFGGEYRWVTGPSDFLQSSRGQYGYTSLDELVNDRVPTLAGFSFQGLGNGVFDQNAKSVGWYVQDDWKISPRLTLNLGLRYDFFGLPKGASANALNSISDCPECGPDGLFWRKPKDDFNNFAPRVGFAWDPTGSGKWAVRGGAGVGYDHIPANFFTNGAPPQKQAVLTTASACAGTFGAPPPWCAGGANPGENFLGSGAMRATFVPPATVLGARGVTSNLMSDNTSPTVYSWSLSVQRELMRDTSVEVRYLGTRATGLPVQTQLNTITAFELGAQPLPTYFSASEVPATVALTAPTRQQFLDARDLRYSAQGFFDLATSFPAIGNSRYHGGAIDFNRRMARGLLLRANYTYAKTQDNATNDLFTSRVNPRRAEDGYNIANEWGRSALDVRHKGAVSWLYEIPNLKLDSGFGRTLLGGWQYSGTYLYQSGQPITVQSGVDSNGNFDAAGDRAIMNPNGASRTGSGVSRVCRDPGTGATSISATCAGTSTVGYIALNPDARYVRAEAGALTNVGRNTENSEPFNVWNMSVFKNNRISETTNVQFRIDMFNVFNTPQRAFGTTSIFGSNGNASSTSYANVASPQFLDETQFDGGGRTVQLGLKISF